MDMEGVIFIDADSEVAIFLSQGNPNEREDILYGPPCYRTTILIITTITHILMVYSSLSLPPH